MSSSKKRKLDREQSHKHAQQQYYKSFVEREKNVLELLHATSCSCENCQYESPSKTSKSTAETQFTKPAQIHALSIDSLFNGSGIDDCNLFSDNLLMVDKEEEEVNIEGERDDNNVYEYEEVIAEDQNEFCSISDLLLGNPFDDTQNDSLLSKPKSITEKLDELKMDETFEVNGKTFCVLEYVLLMCNYIQKSKLGVSNINDLLKLNATLLGTDKIPTSYSKLVCIVNQFCLPFEKKYLCTCNGTHTVNNYKKCSRCGKEGQQNTFFVRDIVKVMEQKLQDVEFWKKINYYPKQEKPEYNDIVYSPTYRERFGSKTKTVGHLTYNLWLDGCSPFKSSNFQLWPLLLSFNEMSLHDRFQPSEVIILGFFVGKPSLNAFLSPIIPRLKLLQEKGLPCCNLLSGKSTTCFIEPFLIIGDIPALRKLWLIKSYNGAYGCDHCLHLGLQITQGKRVFPTRTYADDRTNKSILSAYEKIKQSPQNEIEGHMGIPLISQLVSQIAANNIDGMHSIFLGIMKEFLKRWLDPKFKGKPYNLNKETRDKLAAAVAAVKLPKVFQRKLRPLHEFNRMKAAELRILFFYILPTLLNSEEYLDVQYRDSFNRLSAIIIVLNSWKASQEQIAEATTLLKEEIIVIDSLYSIYDGTEKDSIMTINFHLLEHIGQECFEKGVLYCRSSFPFESFLGVLIRSNNGTNRIEDHLLFMSNLMQFKSLLQSSTQLYTKVTISDEVKKLCGMEVDKVKKSGIQIDSKTRMYSEDIQKKVVEDGIEKRIYKKMIRKGIVYCSKNYSLKKKFNNFVIQYRFLGKLAAGEILYFQRKCTTDNPSELYFSCIVKDLATAVEHEIEVNQIIQMLIAIQNEDGEILGTHEFVGPFYDSFC